MMGRDGRLKQLAKEKRRDQDMVARLHNLSNRQLRVGAAFQPLRVGREGVGGRGWG